MIDTRIGLRPAVASKKAGDCRFCKHQLVYEAQPIRGCEFCLMERGTPSQKSLDNGEYARYLEEEFA